MPWLVRKIDAPKWEICAADQISPDAVTTSLRTQENKLSFWHIATKDELPDIALAVVAGADYISTIDLVLLPEEQIHAASFEAIPTPGDTLVRRITHKHRDMPVDTFDRLGDVAQLVSNAVHSESCERFTAKKLKDLVISAVSSGDLTVENLRPHVRKKVDLGYSVDRPCVDCPLVPHR